MLNYSVDSIREEKARFARDIEYLREMSNDDFTDDNFFALESKFGTSDTYEDYLEAASIMDKVIIDDNDDDMEVQRILEATEDISFDKMIDII